MGVFVMGLIECFLNLVQEHNLWNVLPDLMVFIAPLWIAVLFGVLVGWVWRPTWANSAIKNIPIPIPSKNSSILRLKSQLPGCFFGFSDFGSSESGSSDPDSIGFSDTRWGRRGFGFKVGKKRLYKGERW